MLTTFLLITLPMSHCYSQLYLAILGCITSLHITQDLLLQDPEFTRLQAAPLVTNQHQSHYLQHNSNSTNDGMKFASKHGMVTRAISHAGILAPTIRTSTKWSIY